MLFWRYVRNILGNKYTLALGAAGWLYNPLGLRLFTHALLKQLQLDRHNESVGHKSKVLIAVLVPHLSQVSVHVVLPGDLSALRPVIDLLELGHLLIHLRLNVRACPADRPLLLTIGWLSEAIVFEGELDEPDRHIIVKLKVVALISRLIGLQGDRIDIRSKNQVPVLLTNCWSLQLGFLKGGIKLWWLFYLFWLCLLLLLTKIVSLDWLQLL